ncbi:F-box domain-containing protein [Mycena indigotica]|uniref:F-box domain-containing protein n=1 Tax=Mycena indigotica TaxID=2126181 RepID=A0A8H6SPS3_9AGAR|nr:F-box domain-containing protein [Mycena indigotica]KAF7302142.1 F-box domain-containing protein [Mycena indigotica]
MTRIVLRQAMEQATTSDVKTLESLNHDVLLMIFERLPYAERVKLATLSRRLRAVLLPVIYRRLGWAPGLVDFPPQRILPFTQVFTLAGHNIRRFTPAQHATIASQFREAFPIMKSLHTFILGGNVADGLWSELLDAFAALSNPIDLVVHAHWQPDDEEAEPIKLEPRTTTTLPLRRFSFTVPFIFDVLDNEIARRLPDILESETENVRTILAASLSTMAKVEIPGELISALDGPVWTSLTELYLNGLWPFSDAVEGNSPVAGPSLEHTSSTQSGVVALTSSVESPDTAKDPSVPTEGPPPSPAISKAENEPNPVQVLGVSSTPDTATSTSSEALPSSTVVESPLIPSPATTNPPENAHQSPSPSSAKTSPLLSILERLPNLRILNMMLVFHQDDGPDSRPPICIADRLPSPPFLQHLTKFQATCLPNDDRIIDFLPPNLETLSLRRYPFWLEDGMLRILATPLTIFNLLKRAEFSALTTLKFWYLISTKEELEHEETLLDLLPKLFPLVQDLEFSRRWDHGAPLLEGCQWNPMPIVCDFFPRFKHLESILFDPDLPERDGWPPESYPSSDFREMVGRLHGMAGEIVNAAPWVKSIGMYREFGSNEDLYWEIWGVVPAPDGRVALDRPPPPIVNSIFYP